MAHASTWVSAAKGQPGVMAAKLGPGQHDHKLAGTSSREHAEELPVLGIDTPHVLFTEQPSPAWPHCRGPGGHNASSSSRGQRLLTAEEIQAARPPSRRPRSWFASWRSPGNHPGGHAPGARAEGATILNPPGKARAGRRIVRLEHIFCPNESETSC